MIGLGTWGILDYDYEGYSGTVFLIIQASTYVLKVSEFRI